MTRKLLQNVQSISRLTVAIGLVVLFTIPNGPAQVLNVARLTEKQSLLLIDLQNLAAQATNLTSGLAHARANAEIADALWTLDESRAKELIGEAYSLTSPDLQSSPAGSGSKNDSPAQRSLELARLEARNRVLQVAARDRAFAASLIKPQKDTEKKSASSDNATLAKEAFADKDIAAGSKYLTEAMDADPTAQAALIIQEVAKGDRATADKLIIEYLGILRSANLSPDDSARVHFVLSQLVFPTLMAQEKIPPPSPEVVRAYLLYLVDNLNAVEQVAPGSMRRFRTLLLMAWSPINQYARELIPSYVRLEALSRGNQDTGPIPNIQDVVEADTKAQKKRLEQNLDSETPDAMVIQAGIRNKEFSKVRKALDRMDESETKNYLLELVNSQEAMALTSKGAIDNAEVLAVKLRSAVRIIETYAALIAKSDKKAQKISISYRALEQLRRANNQPEISGMVPEAFARFAPSGKETDPKLASLCKLFLITVSLDDDLAKSLLQETILSMNTTNVDSSQGRLGFDPNLFKEATKKKQLEAEQAALSITDPLRRIVALAAIAKEKIDQLNKAPEKTRK